MADRLVTGTGPQLFFYVQHLLGIGHLARASRIGTALQADGFDVAVVTGGPPVAGFPDPALRQIALPPVTAADQGFSGLVDLDGKPLDDAIAPDPHRGAAGRLCGGSSRISW